MSIYTITPYEYFKQNGEPGNFEDLATLLRLSKAYVFTNEALDMIDQQFRATFAAGFMAHYMFEEIGFETWGRFHFAVQEMTLNKAPYINRVLGLTLKGPFTRILTHQGSDSYTDNGNSVTKDGGKVVTTTDTDETVTNNRSVNGTETDKATRTTDRTEEGTAESESTVKTDGTQNQTQDTTQSSNRTQTQDTAESKTGEDSKVLSRDSKDTTTQNTQSTTEASGSNSANTTTDSTATGTRAFSDTPQNGLFDVENLTYLTDYANTTGTDHGTSETSGTTHNDSTTSNTGDTTVQRTGADTETTQYDSSIKHTGTVTEEGTVKNTGTVSTETDQTVSSNASGTDKRTTQGTEGEDRNKTTGSTENGTTKRGGTVTGTEARDTNSETTDDKTHMGTDEYEDVELQFETIYTSLPIDEKIWELYDELFMMILN